MLNICQQAVVKVGFNRYDKMPPKGGIFLLVVGGVAWWY